MDIHKNARLTPHSRAELVRRVLEEQQSPKAVAGDRISQVSRARTDTPT
jgi:hypothetical protein